MSYYFRSVSKPILPKKPNCEKCVHFNLNSPNFKGTNTTLIKGTCNLFCSINYKNSHDTFYKLSNVTPLSAETARKDNMLCGLYGKYFKEK